MADNNNIINNIQFGLREVHSTTHQVKRVVNLIQSNKNRRFSTGILLLCVEKAFDSNWHNELLFKLCKMKCPMYIVKLIQSFLAERFFVVVVDGQKSSPNPVPAGVPQGFVLSPLWYSLYTHDFKPSIHSDVAFYADDSAFLCSGKVSNTIIMRLQESLKQTAKYFTKWKIKINDSKIQGIIFPFNKSPKRIPTRRLLMQNNEVVILDKIKYLGITLDKYLTYKAHMVWKSTVSFIESQVAIKWEKQIVT